MKTDKIRFRYLLIIVLVGILANWLLNNITVLGSGLAIVGALLFPFLLGIFIAYIFNIPMSFFEKKFLKKVPDKFRRMCSFVLVLLIFIAVILFFGLIVLPEIAKSIISLAQTLPEKWQQLQTSLVGDTQLVQNIQVFLTDVNLDMDTIKNTLIGIVQRNAAGTIQSVFTGAAAVVNGTVMLLISIVFTVYLLFGKEQLCRQVKGLGLAYLPKKWYQNLKYLANLSNDIFHKFITGQCLECLAIGVVFAIVLLVGGFKYWLVIASLICLLSFIPIFGSFIACVIGAFLILVEQGVWRCAAFLVIFIIIQQIDGNVMYPRIVGNSVGLPAIWVLLAVTIGGSLMGIMGMIFFIPLFSVIYVALRDKTVKRLDEKQISLSDMDASSSA